MSKQHDQIKFNNSDKPPLASSGSSGIVNQVKKKFEKLEKSKKERNNEPTKKWISWRCV